MARPRAEAAGPTVRRRPFAERTFYLLERARVRYLGGMLRSSQWRQVRAIAKSPLFDQNDYEKRSGAKFVSRLSGARHFFLRSHVEIVDPGPGFSAVAYLSEHLDVAGTDLNPLAHYEMIGRGEGRHIRPVKHYGIDASEWNGLEERVRASGIFDPEWYRERYRDARVPGVEPLQHFVHRGIEELRWPNPLFDPDWYSDTNSDVRRGNVNPLIHYFSYGQFEDRRPCREFSPAWYRTEFPDLEASGERPFAHFLRVGRPAGISGIPPRADPQLAAMTHRVISEQQRLSLERHELERHVACMLRRPTFVILAAPAGEEDADAIRKELGRQLYPGFVLSRSRAEAVAALDAEPDGFLVWLEPGDRLDPRALYLYAAALNRSGDIEILYGDEDVEGVDPRHEPLFAKPDWSPDLLESFNYLGHGLCVAAEIARKALAEAEGLYDFALRATDAAVRVAHVSEVLCYRQEPILAPGDPEAVDRDCRALRARLARTGRSGAVTGVAEGYPVFSITLAGRPAARVSVVIPTEGGRGGRGDRSADLLLNCIERMAAPLPQVEFDFIVVNTGRLGAKLEAALGARGVRRVTVPSASAGLSQKINRGAQEARGEYLLLLNKGLEPISADWLPRMLDHFCKPHVGCVGAKILSAAGEVLHAGLVFDGGRPEPVYRGMPRDAQGYFFSAAAARNYSAVSGACLLTRTELFHDAGGFDETLGDGLGDSDFCLAIAARGRSIVYEPRAELRDLAPDSRDAQVTHVEDNRFQRKWVDRVDRDPFYDGEMIGTQPAGSGASPFGAGR